MTATKKMTNFEKRDRSCYDHWKSSGATGELLDFYTTQYATNYFNRTAEIKPSKCNPSTNGFVSNERNVLCYNRSMDSVDNPPMGDLCLENYCSVSRHDFPAYANTSSWENPNPRTCFRVPSSFTKNTVYEPAKGSVPTKSVTWQDLEKGFVRRDLQASNLRRKPPTGITTNNPFFDTLSGCSRRSFVDGYPGWMTDRPTGVSVTKTDFIPFKFEPNLTPKMFPKIITNPVQDSNRTAEMVSDPAEILKEPQSKNKATVVEMSGILHKDPIEFWNMIEPTGKSVYNCSYKKRPIGETRREHEIHIGPKNKSIGDLKNLDFHVWQRDNPGRFLTHYSTNYWQQPDRTSNTPFPYFVNEFCRVDANPVK